MIKIFAAYLYRNHPWIAFLQKHYPLIIMKNKLLRNILKVLRKNCLVLVLILNGYSCITNSKNMQSLPFKKENNKKRKTSQKITYIAAKKRRFNPYNTEERSQAVEHLDYCNSNDLIYLIEDILL